MRQVESVTQTQLDDPNRRSFLAGLLAAGSATVGALLAIPLVRFTLHPVLARTTEKSWSDVGKVDDFQNLDAKNWSPSSNATAGAEPLRRSPSM
jgi:hypothetical protein